MTQIESIQKNIHDVRIQLKNSREAVANDEMQKMFKAANIEDCLNELKELRFCLKCAIKNQSI